MKHFLRTFIIALSISPIVSQAQQFSLITKVGAVHVYGNASGAAFITRQDGSNFPHCTAQPNVAWVDGNFVTPDGAKSVLSTLLFAKATNNDIQVYYVVDASGNCRYQIVTLL